MMNTNRVRVWRPLRAREAWLFLAIVISIEAGASAQPVIDAKETLSFDRPESWAMKYFTAVSVPTSLGSPEELAAGSVLVGFEGDHVPQLSDDQRRVGFNGTKLEDVNKTSFFGRIRGDVGLGGHFALELGFVPPVEVNGATPKLFFAGIARTFQPSRSWRLGLRGYGQWGTIEGDITCGAPEAAAGPDAALNPFACEAPSADRLKQRLLGGALTLGFGSGRVRPYVGAALHHAALTFEVNARYAGFVDRTIQDTDGPMLALTGGLSVAASARWRLGGEVFYAPLSVVRPPGTSSRNDGLVQGRFFVSFLVR